MKLFRTTTPALVLLAAALTVITVAGCEKGKPTAPATVAPTSQPTSQPAPLKPPASGPRIIAEPNPVPAGPGKGTTTILWNTGDGTMGEVYVSTNGEDEKLFADKCIKGSLEAAWIQKGQYEFRLYAGKEHKTVLSSVKVTRAAK